MKLVLKVQTGSSVAELEMKMKDVVILGRGTNASHKLADSKLSNAHCRLVLMTDKLMVYDLGSKNGTTVNGIKIETAEVYIGDEIKIGETKITIHTVRMDKETVAALTFKGNPLDRNGKNLRLDYTAVFKKPK